MLTYKLLAAILPLCYIIISYLEVILGPPRGYPPFLLMLEAPHMGTAIGHPVLGRNNLDVVLSLQSMLVWTNCSDY